MMIQAADLLATTKRPTEAQIRTAMNGHLCRCGTYPRILTAIQKAARVMAKGASETATSKEFSRRVPEGRRRAARRVCACRCAPAHRSPSASRSALGPGQPDQKQLDSWLAIHADNTATVFHGHAELGQGTSTALLQIAAEELDLSMEQMNLTRLSSDRSPNQGGTVASAAIALGGPRVRAAAAEARQALLALASAQLGAPVAELTVAAGVVSVRGAPTRSVTYGDLLGDRPFNLPFTGKAPVKAPRDYKIVGTNVPRKDIPAKAAGTHTHMQHVRGPGMWHGRVVRPRGQGSYGDGARVVSVDERSISHIPHARAVRRGDFVGVVAPNEWDAVRAARELRVTWETTATLPGTSGMHAQMRKSKTVDRVVLETGNVDAALRSAAQVVTRSYRGPYQAHAPFAPNCAIADVGKRASASSVLDAEPLRNARQGCEGHGRARGPCQCRLLRKLGQLRSRLLRRRGRSRGDHVATHL